MCSAESRTVISSVRGEVLVRRPGEVVVESAGVGYRLAVSSETLDKVPAVGAETLLHSHLVLRDDGIHLFGFASETERELFLMLIGVQGVGPKVAQAVLSGGPPRELLGALANGDAARFQAVPGIGKRTAERIIVELRGSSEAREALLGLGYMPPEADALLDGTDGETAEELIAEALTAAR